MAQKNLNLSGYNKLPDYNALVIGVTKNTGIIAWRFKGKRKIQSSSVLNRDSLALLSLISSGLTFTFDQCLYSLSVEKGRTQND